MPIHPLFIALRHARQAQGRSQFDLTSEIGCGAHGVSRWETGRVPPNFPHLIAWIEALNLDVSLTPRPRK